MTQNFSLESRAVRERYSRQMLLPEIGEAGQKRLANSTALIVGAGGLGGPAACFLAASGVGVITLVDGDRVELSNLGRQIIHGTDRLGQAKVTSAASSLRALNPEIRVETVDGWVDEENAETLITAHDVVVDACDNFSTRYLLNALCHRIRRPLVTGAVLGFDGQVTLLQSGLDPTSPCYQCLYPEQPDAAANPTCATAGVVGALVGVVGSLQAMEALKVLLGIGNTRAGETLLINLLDGIFHRVRGVRLPECPVCGTPSP
ncbi:MAG: HesA/MoeB/ThiF family protein [Magnetococcales bacterium]|nr:HesA/MoeB/ThiF family protein [Magnetococcales bacterium]MBF0322037.1 HesA/MoeB/ThiF family protein [Magnetococcales bacterium]